MENTTTYGTLRASGTTADGRTVTFTSEHPIEAAVRFGQAIRFRSGCESNLDRLDEARILASIDSRAKILASVGF